ncbi:hypothetical protein, partial [Nocardia abscessus]|uniref:hypothetical protein n=1 Tax=Nocardia abscessus TaxID=120957 RepID=UPI002458DB98
MRPRSADSARGGGGGGGGGGGRGAAAPAGPPPHLPRAVWALRGRMRQPLTQQAQKRAHRARRRGERVAL